jgi:Asp-tRNA(Asn)/Glu-tRNA(Gln) amidotransferase A subunit family amidase
LEELWIVAREISARAGGDPGFPGLSGPRMAPTMRRPAAIAVLQTAGFSAASPAAEKCLSGFLEKIASAGIRVLTRNSDKPVADAEAAIQDAGSLSRAINAWESRWPLNTYARDIDRLGLSAVMRTRLSEAEGMTLEGYQDLLKQRARSRTTYSALSTVCDACLTLSAPGPAPQGIASTGDPNFAIPASLLGVPAVSLPLFEAENLPLGLQVLGFADRDADLFAVAAFLQNLQPPIN